MTLAGFTAIISSYVGTHACNAYKLTSHPLLVEWFKAVAEWPTEFSGDWRSASSALPPEHFRYLYPTQGQRKATEIPPDRASTQLSLMFHTISWRLHMDWVLGPTSPLVTDVHDKRFERFTRWHDRATHQLFCGGDSNLASACDPTLVGELAFLRPPQDQGLWKKDGEWGILNRWCNQETALIPRGTRSLAIVKVPTNARDEFTNRSLATPAHPHAEPQGATGNTRARAPVTESPAPRLRKSTNKKARAPQPPRGAAHPGNHTASPSNSDEDDSEPGTKRDNPPRQHQHRRGEPQTDNSGSSDNGNSRRRQTNRKGRKKEHSGKPKRRDATSSDDETTSGSKGTLPRDSRKRSARRRRSKARRSSRSSSDTSRSTIDSAAKQRRRRRSAKRRRSSSASGTDTDHLDSSSMPPTKRRHTKKRRHTNYSPGYMRSVYEAHAHYRGRDRHTHPDYDYPMHRYEDENEGHGNDYWSGGRSSLRPSTLHYGEEAGRQHGLVTHLTSNHWLPNTALPASVLFFNALLMIKVKSWRGDHAYSVAAED